MTTRADSPHLQKATESDVRALYRVPIARYVLAFAMEWVSISLAIGIAMEAENLGVYLVAVAFIGTRQHALSILGHDGAHSLYTSNRRLNDCMMNLLVFWPLGATGAGYRRWHLRHHAHTADADDPEAAIKSGWRYQMPAGFGKFCGMFAFDFVGGGLPELVKLLTIAGAKSLPDLVGLVVFWSVAIAGVWLADAWMVLALWIGSIMTSFWAYFRVRNWSEHQGVHGTLRFHAGPLARFFFFPYNTWCHYEHHRWPAVPCFNLTKARTHDRRVRVLALEEMFRFFGGRSDIVRDIPRRASGVYESVTTLGPEEAPRT